MKNLRQKNCDISVGGDVIKSHIEWDFCGKWYKPWTWFNWRKVTVITEFELREFSFMTNPVNEESKIKR